MTAEIGDKTKPAFTDLPDFACEKNGGTVVFATDDFFAVAENLLKEDEPVWDASKFTEFGKWMDGWETRRKRSEGHDWCIIKLGCECTVEGIVFDTSHFTGNYAPSISVQAANLSESKEFDCKRKIGGEMGSAASEEQFKLAGSFRSESWCVVVPETKLSPGVTATRLTYRSVQESGPFTHIRVNIFPDGGVARLHVYGRVCCNFSKFYSSNESESEEINLTDLFHGAKAVGCSNAHFGKPENLLRRSKALIMADGWETARKADRPSIYKRGTDGNLIIPGYDWCILQFGHAAYVKRIVVDTNHFKGNFPESCIVYGVYLPELLKGRRSSQVSAKCH